MTPTRVLKPEKEPRSNLREVLILCFLIGITFFWIGVLVHAAANVGLLDLVIGGGDCLPPPPADAP